MKKSLLMLLLIPFLLGGCNKKNKSNSEEETQDVQYIDVSVTEISLHEGEQFQIPIEILKKTIVICQSNDENIATVTHDGLVTATGQGETTITISGGKNRFIIFVTVAPELAKDSLQIVMVKEEFTIQVGDEYILPITVKYGNEVVASPTLSYTYETEGIVSIAGLTVTGVAAGSTKCVVLASYNEMTTSSSFTITVYWWVR